MMTDLSTLIDQLQTSLNALKEQTSAQTAEITEVIASHYYNPLRTYTVAELAELMHCSGARVSDWVTTGLIKGIKTGKGLVFTSPEIERFQAAMAGQDISNLVQATRAAR